MRTFAMIAMLLVAGACSSPTAPERALVTFWLLSEDSPEREPDPYAFNPGCELVEKESEYVLEDPEDFSSGTFWWKLTYWCEVEALR